MSLRRFLNVAYAILVEEYQRMGIDLISALEKVADLGGGKATEHTTQAVPKVVAAANEQAYNAIGAMMAGVTGPKPRVGK